MRQTFIHALSGNKQTDEMVEFTRGILHIPSNRVVKNNLIDASIRYVITDPAVMKQSEVLGRGSAAAMRAKERMEFWSDLYDQNNSYGVPGLYYATALAGIPATTKNLQTALWPHIKKIDAALQADPNIGPEPEKKIAALYASLLIEGELSEQQRNFAFDSLLGENIMATKTAQPRGLKTYAYGMTMILTAAMFKCEKVNNLTTDNLFDDNRDMAQTQGLDVLTVFEDMHIKMLAFGSFEKMEKVYGAEYTRD